ncbi:cotranscriptional regulator FAM172A-like [Balamuthia mandrillaris]
MDRAGDNTGGAAAEPGSPATCSLLEELGYYFDDEGRLREMAAGNGWSFTTKEDMEAVGEAVVQHIQRQMREDGRYGPLEEIWLPLSDKEEEEEEDAVEEGKRRTNKKRKISKRPACLYGSKCYRQNPTHPQKYSHGSEEEKEEEKEEKKATNKKEYEKEGKATPQEPRCNIFLSKNWQRANRLILFICGMGPARAGQWSRKLCLGDSLQTGSLLPYLERAKNEGYGVAILNPNLNSVPTTPTTKRPEEEEGEEQDDKVTTASDKVAIPHNENGFMHMLYVWDNILWPGVNNATKLFIVSHSFGGVHAVALMSDRQSQVLPKLRGVAFTDSVHTTSDMTPPSVLHFLQRHCKNWVASSSPLDEPVEDPNGCHCPCVSAGHTMHEMTSSTAMDSVFRFFQEQTRRRIVLPKTLPSAAAAAASSSSGQGTGAKTMPKKQTNATTARKRKPANKK